LSEVARATFTHEDVEVLARKITILEGELVEERRARELTEENSRGLPDIVLDAERQWEVSERERREQFEELTLLQPWCSELCHAIIGAPQVRNHFSKGMHVAALCHTEVARELAAWAAVSSAMELALGCSPNEVFRMEVMGELVAKF
jgi:hypothetical protein